MKKYLLFLSAALLFIGTACAQVQIKEVEPTKPDKFDIPNLTKMQRLFRISPRFEEYEALKILMENGFNSAQSIAIYSRKDFVEKAKAVGINEEIAISIHEKVTKSIFEKKQKKIAPNHSDKTGVPQKYRENNEKK